MGTEALEAILQELALYSSKVVSKGLVVGPGGNTSVREGSIMWISPSGFALDGIAQADWVGVDINTGEALHPTLRPSSEVVLHRLIYQARSDVQAIVHTHPPITIAVISSGHNEIPPMFPDYVALVGKLPYLDYIKPCTDELAEAAANVLKDCRFNGLLLKNHGLITVGSTLKQAYCRAELVEDAARVFWMSSQMGTPRTLTVAEQEAILDLEPEKYRQQLLGKARNASSADNADSMGSADSVDSADSVVSANMGSVVGAIVSANTDSVDSVEYADSADNADRAGRTG